MALNATSHETVTLDPLEVSEELVNALKAAIREQSDADTELPDSFTVGSVVLDSRENGTDSHAVIVYNQQND